MYDNPVVMQMEERNMAVVKYLRIHLIGRISEVGGD